MAEQNSMNIIETCRVAPNSSSPSFLLPLTFFDKVWLTLDPTSRLFFYEFPEQKPESSDVYVTRLKKSLSHTLHHYLPLAGRLIWPSDSDKPLVQYQKGDAISLTLAQTQADFHSLSSNEFRGCDVLRSLLPDFPTSEDQAPVMTLKMTLFTNNMGLCIGYIAHHGVMDGKSISMFLHSWAYICRNGDDDAVLPLELTPSYDRTFISQQEELEKVFPKHFGPKPQPKSGALTIYDMQPPPDTMLGTFVLTREDIHTLKRSVIAYWEKNKKLNTTSTRLSTFIVSTAYVLMCFIKAKKETKQHSFIGINVNARARLVPPIPPNYFGNCVVWCGGNESTEKLLSVNGFVIAVEVIIKALGTLDEGLVEVNKKFNDLMTSLMTFMTNDVVELVGVAGSPQFELYKVDFGWGKPKKVEMVSIDKGSSIYLSDDRDGNGGIEIGVAMKTHEAEAFASVFASELHGFYLP